MLWLARLSTSKATRGWRWRLPYFRVRRGVAKTMAFTSGVAAKAIRFAYGSPSCADASTAKRCARIAQRIGRERLLERGTQHRAEDPQRRRLARPVGPQQPEDLAGPDLHLDAPQGVDSALVRLGDVKQIDRQVTA